MNEKAQIRRHWKRGALWTSLALSTMLAWAGSAWTQSSEQAPSDKTLVTGLRFLSSKTTTRILLELSQEAKYEIGRVKEDPAKGLPPRVYVDIANARLALASKEPMPVDDDLLRQVRLGQYGADVVRVVLDLQAPR